MYSRSMQFQKVFAQLSTVQVPVIVGFSLLYPAWFTQRLSQRKGLGWNGYMNEDTMLKLFILNDY
ncbi:hypothetical protein K7432_007257 [Basidiobolus ranarum]|uniref:Uncharacterized protein n=1 Tax=Basidiobolus ranarum TaxID=34480 RepID=A0ABR2W0D2_9FUNG